MYIMCRSSLRLSGFWLKHFQSLIHVEIEKIRQGNISEKIIQWIAATKRRSQTSQLILMFKLWREFSEKFGAVVVPVMAGKERNTHEWQVCSPGSAG